MMKTFGGSLCRAIRSFSNNGGLLSKPYYSPPQNAAPPLSLFRRHLISSSSPTSAFPNRNSLNSSSRVSQLNHPLGAQSGSLKVADICDSNLELCKSCDIRILQPIFQIYGKKRAFSGPIYTLRVPEHNLGVKEIVETEGKGRVLFIDSAGSMRMAVVGDNLCLMAQKMGWAGIVVNGCIRDVDEIYESCDSIGLRALAAHPGKPGKKGETEEHVPIHVAGTVIHDGEWLYADADGILISKTQVYVDPAKLTNYFK